MNPNFSIPDYRISSIRIFKGTALAFFSLVFLLLLAEYFLDLRSTSLEILVPVNVVTLTAVILAFRFPDSRILRIGLTVLAYLIVEFHFLLNPSIHHSIFYWLPFIPLIALLIIGLRASQIWLLVILISHGINYLILTQMVGDKYPTHIYPAPTFVIGTIYILGILASSYLLYALLGNAYDKVKTGNAELENLKTKTELKKELLQKYLQTLISLSKDAAVISHGKAELFKGVCSAAADALKVNRVSIWILQDENKRLVRKFQYEHEHDSDEEVGLDRNHYPVYFKSLETKPYILATNAREDAETREMTEGYLIPLGIYSMLDCPIIIDRIPIGVICCENQHSVKEWDTEDALFIQSLADFIAMSYKNDQVKSLLNEVRNQNFDLVEKSNEITAMNEELHSLNETLATMNESLEGIVKSRTIELETQNKQLTEYAFINSHLLRAPLSRILGLSHLITREVNTVNEKELVNALITATNELDSIVRKISDILYDGNNLSREDIKEIIDRRLHQNE